MPGMVMRQRYPRPVPWAPRRQCPTAGCPRLLAAGERCPEHGTQPFATSTYRHNAPLPEKLRQQILARDRFTCRRCGSPAANHVDHIIPRAQGGTDHPGNLRALCEACHRAKTAAEANTARWRRRRA